MLSGTELRREPGEDGNCISGSNLDALGAIAHTGLASLVGAENMTPSRDIRSLLEIMSFLRTPEKGCPWDQDQDFSTIAPYTIEEAYEVADAIQRGDLADLRDELGDLLLQVVFHARIAEERAAFDFGDVVEGITAKLIRRHPYVFGDARHLGQDEVKRLWDVIKESEKAERAARRTRDGMEPDATGLLADVPIGLPGLTRAEKLTRKAATVGFDWPDASRVMEKIEEELDEVREAAATGVQDRIEDEIGDLLFAVANLARHFEINPEAALRRANAKFERRFHFIERSLLDQGRSLAEADLDEMESLWGDAKANEGRGEAG